METVDVPHIPGGDRNSPTAALTDRAPSDDLAPSNGRVPSVDSHASSGDRDVEVPPTDRLIAGTRTVESTECDRPIQTVETVEIVESRECDSFRQ
ncbi:MAG: hypothetical protein GDA43_04880 [Hormoscilla sp. SP5CHS1]|nr:hypothetical protein [Hormoscilla sp. SP12CHS1]MBC6452602.1 hypothetical protein [Hormoscilla sp. SP5CHS1]